MESFTDKLIKEAIGEMENFTDKLIKEAIGASEKALSLAREQMERANQLELQLTEANQKLLLALEDNLALKKKIAELQSEADADKFGWR